MHEPDAGQGLQRPLPHVVLIAAVAGNGVIGDGPRLPWHLPEDMRHFRRVTTGHPVIMGRKTWDSLPERFRPLPERRNIVVTRNAAWRADGALTAASARAALALATAGERAYVIGGAELYAAALPLADELMLTEIERDFEGDIHFPPVDRTRWTEIARERHRAAAPNDFDFSFVTYRRNA